MAFYQNFYHPANTVVTIVGDIFALTALGQIQVNFGDFKKATANQSKQSEQQPAPASGAPKTTAANSKPTSTPADSKSANQAANQPADKAANQPSGQSAIP